MRFGGIVALDERVLRHGCRPDRRPDRSERRRQDHALQLPRTPVYAPAGRHPLRGTARSSPRRTHHIAALGIGRTFQNLALFPTMSVLDNVMVGVHSRTRSDFASNALKLPWVGREEREARDAARELIAFLDLEDVAGPSGRGAALRHAQARRAGPGAGQPAAAPAPRRAGGRPQPRGSGGAGRAGSRNPRRAASHGAAGRAPHEPGHAGVGQGRRARLRPEDRRGPARRGPAQSRSDQGLPWERATDARAARGGEPGGAVRVRPRSSTAWPSPSRRAASPPSSAPTARARRRRCARSAAWSRRPASIRFDGQRIDGKPTEEIVRLGIAHTPEGRGTFMDLTRARRTCGWAPTRGATGGAIADDFERVYEYFPVLAERRRQQAGTLSGGEQQMLAVARALMSRPRLLLLDEPSLGLAPLVTREIFRIVRAINQDAGRQRAAGRAERRAWRSSWPTTPTCSRRDASCMSRPVSAICSGTTSIRRSYLGLLRSEPMDIFIQQVVSGLATGGIYASLALALVMIYQATDVVNFAQGEMAMFSTYLCWSLLQLGLPYWVAFFATLVIAFVGGLLIERIVLRPVERRADPHHRHRDPRARLHLQQRRGLDLLLRSRSPSRARSRTSPSRSATSSSAPTTWAPSASRWWCSLLLFLFFRYTTLGLAMRAAAQNPTSSRLCGIRVGWMLALGWGLAAAFGAVAGMMVAPVVFLDPNMMGGIQLYAFAAATVGGFTSPRGAVVGGLPGRRDREPRRHLRQLHRHGAQARRWRWP